jgi:hypothetical protein
MSAGYAKERIEFFENRPEYLEAIGNGLIWSISPVVLRFKLGHSIAELKVP